MAEEHQIEARILLRYDTYDKWIRNDPILKMGEAAVCVIPRTYNLSGTDNRPDNTPPAVGIKIGDGYGRFSELPWVQGIAADVYNWAKRSEKPTYSADEIQDLEAFIQAHSSGGGGSGSGDIIAREYQLVRGQNDNINKYYLQYRTASDGDWIVDTLHYIDLNDLSNISNWIGEAINDYWTLESYINQKATEKVNTLDYPDSNDYENVVVAVSQNNGLINVEKMPLNAGMMTGVLSVSQGGTGQRMLEPEEALIGNGTSAIKSKPISNTVENDSNLITGHAVVNYVTAATAGITGAMHYIGEATVDMTYSNGHSINPQIAGYNFSQAQPGDVVTYDAKEYVWEGSYWRLLGDEGSYAVKGSITNADIADDANIAISKIYRLETTLENKVNVIEGKGLSTNDFTDDYQEKLDNIEDRAQRNLIEHIFINGVEAIPKVIENQPNALNIKMSSLTPEEEEKLRSIESNAQVNLIEHIFVNETEITPSVIKNLNKSVNIDLTEITEKLSTIETGAQVNKIESIYLNNEEVVIDNKRATLIIDPAAVNFTVVEGAIVPDGNEWEDVALNATNRKLQFARIAKTGRIYDIQDTTAADAADYLILRCGNSTTLID